MKTYTRLLLFFLIFGFYSCQQKEQKKSVVQEAANEPDVDFQFPAVSLNDGQLWEANTETTQGIKNMQQLMADFSIDSGNSEELIVHLEDEFTLIFKKCTMTGVSHEQLHNYLIPLKFKIESLSEGVTVEKTVDVKTYLDDYFNYFQ